MPAKKPAPRKKLPRAPRRLKRSHRLFASALIYPETHGRFDPGEDPRKVVAREQLAVIRDTLGIKTPDLADLFGVKRQAVEQWLAQGVPLAQAARADRLYEVVAELAKRFKPQRLPAIVRERMPILGDRSVLETLASDGPAAIFEFFYRWDSYIPDVDPILAGEFSHATGRAAR